MRTTTILFILGTQLLYSQRVHQLQLSATAIVLENPGFYIEDVIDARPEKPVASETLGTEIAYEFEDGLVNDFLFFYQNALEAEDHQPGISVKITQLHFFEKSKVEYSQAFVKIGIDYYHENTLLYRNEQLLKMLGKTVTHLHSKNLEEALKNSLLEFSKANWQDKLIGGIAPKKEMPIVKSSATYRKHNRDAKNVFAVGYQIGGFTLIGFDYEVRLTDYIGVHMGAGILGATAGVKLHMGAHKNSPFLNFNFKDGGFGLLSTKGIDFGGRIPLSKKNDFAIHLQFCYAVIDHIDPEVKDEIFGVGQDAADGILTIGAGFSW